MRDGVKRASALHIRVATMIGSRPTAGLAVVLAAALLLGAVERGQAWSHKRELKLEQCDSKTYDTLRAVWSARAREHGARSASPPQCSAPDSASRPQTKFESRALGLEWVGVEDRVSARCCGTGCRDAQQLVPRLRAAGWPLRRIWYCGIGVRKPLTPRRPGAAAVRVRRDAEVEAVAIDGRWQHVPGHYRQAERCVSSLWRQPIGLAVPSGGSEVPQRWQPQRRPDALLRSGIIRPRRRMIARGRLWELRLGVPQLRAGCRRTDRGPPPWRSPRCMLPPRRAAAIKSVEPVQVLQIIPSKKDPSKVIFLGTGTYIW